MEPASRTSSNGALVPAKALPPIPKKPLPKPPGSSSSTQLAVEDPLLNKIAEELAFAFHQSTEFVKRYATNLQLIQAQPQYTITNGFYKTIRISEKAMQECIVPLVVSCPEILLFDCTWIVVEPNSLVSLINASAHHSLRQLLITRMMTPKEKITLRKNLQHLKARCQPKEAWAAFVKYVINPNYNTQPAFDRTLFDLTWKHKREPGSTRLWIIERDEQAVFVPEETDRAAIHVSGISVTNFGPSVSIAKRTRYRLTCQIRDIFKEVEQRGAARALPNGSSMIDRVRFIAEDPISIPFLGQQKGPLMTITDALKFVILYALYTDEQFDVKLEDKAKDKAKSYLKKVKNDPIKGPLRDLGRGCIFDQTCVDKLLRPIYTEFPAFITLSLSTFVGGVDFDVVQKFLQEKPAITRMVIAPKQFDDNELVKLQQVLRAVGRDIDVKETVEVYWYNPFENTAKTGAKKCGKFIRSDLGSIFYLGMLPDGPVDIKQDTKIGEKSREIADTWLKKVNNRPYEGPLKNHGKGCIFDQQCVDGLLNPIYDENPQFMFLSLASFLGKVDFKVLESFLKARPQISRLTYQKDQFSAEDLTLLKKIVTSLNSDKRILALRECKCDYDNPFRTQEL